MTSDEKVQTYEIYLSAWSAVPDADRARLLRKSLAEDIVFKNLLQTRRGLTEVTEHLEGFQMRSPRGAFRLNNMVGWDSYALAEWQLVDANGDPGFSGYDVLTFDEHGLISSILLFGNVEAQKLAWRRRDRVTMELTA